MTFGLISRGWRWARLLLSLCALALTAACMLLEGPYPSDRDWPFGADVSQVTLVQMKEGKPEAASEKLVLARSYTGLRWRLESPGGTADAGQLSIKYLGLAPEGKVYGYAIPHSDLPSWPEIAANKLDGVRGDEFAAFAVFGRIIFSDQMDAQGRALLGFSGPICPKTIEPNCSYDTSAAVWNVLAAQIPVLRFEEMGIYAVEPNG
ncbi:hypothetical protein MCEMIH15_02887 [Caulobacteraceae bacterium]